MWRIRPGYLVLALTVFAALAVGATGAILLARYRADALRAVADRQALLVSLQARLIEGEITRLVAEMTRLSQLAEVDLADENLEPEKRVLRIARRDTVLFSVSIVILDQAGTVLWSEPQGTTLAASASALVREARGTGRATLTLSPGELDVAAPIAGHGAIVGKVSTSSRDLFGEALQRAVRGGGGVALVRAAANGAAGEVIAGLGEGSAVTLASGEPQAWRSDGQGRSWLVTEARVGDESLLLRLAQPTADVEGQVLGAVRSLAAIVGGALLLALVGGALLAVSIQRLERASAELGRSRELAAMGKTAAAIAHEVKNSLNGLSIAIDLLAAGRAPRDAAEKVHAQARSEIARLRGVADDLTLFAAPPRLELGACDLDEICTRAVDACADLASDCGAYVALDLGPQSTRRVRGDAHKLLGAVQNLVRNGIEAMGPGAFGEPLGAPAPARDRRLDVALRMDGRQAVIEIADRGGGIPPEVQERLFEPFVTTKRSGTGLGLAIARRVVEAHGGTLAAAPRDGGGTVFRIVLPIDEVSAPLRAAARTAG